jgi:CheY-like chemotaxis protein
MKNLLWVFFFVKKRRRGKLIKTILIVEDEHNFHDLYELMLEGTGCEIIRAYDGYEALEKLTEKKPDLIILDILLDMMTGDTFFLYLKSMPEYVDIPVIMVSSFPARKYKNLRQIDPGLVFLKKQHLTKERLLDEVEKKFLKTKKACRITFSLPKVAAPEAKSVCIVGDFNNWNTHVNPMKKLKDGDYSIKLDLEPGREYQFRYLIDELKWENDRNADKYVRSVYGDCDNSVVIVDALD